MIKLFLLIVFSHSCSAVIWTDELIQHLPKYQKNEMNVLIVETPPYLVLNKGTDLWDGLDILILQTILSKLNLKAILNSTKSLDSISQEYLE